MKAQAVRGLGIRVISYLLAAGLVVSGLSGCSKILPQPSEMEKNYGEAVMYNASVMMVNPPKKQEEAPAVGMGPWPASTAYESYTKTFVRKEGEKPARISLGVTGGAFGGGGE